MRGWAEDISRTLTATNDSPTQGEESRSRFKSRIWQPPSEGSSTPETPTLDKLLYDSSRVLAAPDHPSATGPHVIVGWFRQPVLTVILLTGTLPGANECMYTRDGDTRATGHTSREWDPWYRCSR
jgi:hypothetical protein